MPHHEATVDNRHLIVYGAILVVVVLIGVYAIWSFIEQQSVAIQPEPLPKVTVVTARSGSPLGAAWVRLLNEAELQATLVPLETFDPIEGVVIFCDVEEIPPRLASLLEIFVERGGAIGFVGTPPRTPIGRFRLFHDTGIVNGPFRLSEHVSPVLARSIPGYVIRTARPGRVALLKETPRMVVDARWDGSERAAAMHVEIDGARYLWFGIDPRMLPVKRDQALHLVLRTAFRWVAGQPVSDGAIGDPQSAKTLTPGARRQARSKGFGFSVDRMRGKDDVFSIRMVNRGGVPLSNPTVKLWVPPDVTRVAFSGSFIMFRDASLTGIPEDGTVLVSLPRLRRNEDRVMKLEIVERRPRPEGKRAAAR
jgi:hypothetical protein